MHKRSRIFAASVVVFAFALVAAACGGGGDDTTTTAAAAETTTAAPAETTTAAPAETTTAAPTETTEAPDLTGRSVTVFGPESSDVEAGAQEDALNAFASATGIKVQYTGARDFSDQINAQAAAGNPPDIAVFPQPGKLADFARQGFLVALPDDVASVAGTNWGETWLEFGNVDGTQYGIPTKTDLKSIVWYNTALFEAGGYTIPTTWDELKTLTNTMIADGVTPWCVGIESGPATGWPFTDWMEELVMRTAGPDAYDQWVSHEIPFSDASIVGVAEDVLSVWNTPGAVFAAGGSIAATPFGDNGAPLVNGDCVMHRQANFFGAFLPEGTETGPGKTIDVFYFPAVDPSTAPVLTAGTVIASFSDRPEVWEVMKYMSSPEYATNRQTAQAERQGGAGTTSGYLSAAIGQDMGAYNDLERSFIDILATASPARFDGSDLMPAAVGSGTFWTEGTSAVNGDKSVADAFAAIDDSWPS